MSTSIKLKKSSISGRIPSTSDLDYGELAINYADGILYFKNSGNTVQSINASPSGIDSSATINLIDSAYVQARQSSTGGGIDSAAVVSIIDSAVNQTFVNNLNVDADTLDGQDGSYYLNYNNLTNVPSQSSSGVDYGSIIVAATSAIDLLIAVSTVDYGTPNAPAGLISDYGTI